MDWCNIEEQSDTDGKESEEVVKQHKRQWKSIHRIVVSQGLR
jgi:hypothetical protein